DGYITRERSKEDERVTIISITKKGTDLKEKCKDIPQKIAASNTHLSEEDAVKLYQLLYKFLDD
ncbi:MAG: MarR family transcriptional regulator, partial [Lachnospiraceae bacterium]|nr:MarR family transcriptional regulator [Lachnospiraceae bacterium]